MRQEGLAAVFAGATPNMSSEERNRSRELIRALGNDPPYPQVFAVLYGDAAAEQLGYVPVGLPPRAGFDVALAAAIERQSDPVAALKQAGEP